MYNHMNACINNMYAYLQHEAKPESHPSRLEHLTSVLQVGPPPSPYERKQMLEVKHNLAVSLLSLDMFEEAGQVPLQ